MPFPKIQLDANGKPLNLEVEGKPPVQGTKVVKLWRQDPAAAKKFQEQITPGTGPKSTS